MTAALARHEVANKLSDYCKAVDDRDAIAVATLLADAELVFRGTRLTSRDAVIGLYERAFADGTTTAHLVMNLHVEARRTGPTVFTWHYVARYQRWEHEHEPRCTALGTYRGTFEGAGEGLRWVTHEVITLTSTR